MKPDKNGQKVKKRSVKKSLRDQMIVQDSMTDMSGSEIANKYGLSRQWVSTILNSQETKEILKKAESAFLQRIDRAVEIFDKAMDGYDVDMTNALNAATKILKSTGVIKEKSEIAHSFPKPTVIRRKDGSEVILGTKEDEDSDDK